MTVDEDGVVQTPFLRTRYNYDMDRVSRETALMCTDETRTQQQFQEECDINTIVERFGITGQLPTNARMPLLEPFIEAMDYKESLNALMAADEAFMQMPAEVRKRFQNNAGAFVDFVNDEKNLEQCREWGLAVPAAKEPDVPVVKLWTEPGSVPAS